MESDAILKLKGVSPESLAQLHAVVKDITFEKSGKKYVSILKSSLEEGYETYIVTLGINWRLLFFESVGVMDKGGFFSYLSSAKFYSILRALDSNILCESENFVVPADRKTAEGMTNRESEKKFECLRDAVDKLVSEIFGDKSTKAEDKIHYVNAIGTKLASSLGDEIQRISTNLSRHSIENDFSGFAYRGENEKISLLAKQMEILCKEYLKWHKKRKEEIMASVPER